MPLTVGTSNGNPDDTISKIKPQRTNADLCFHDELPELLTRMDQKKKKKIMVWMSTPPPKLISGSWERLTLHNLIINLIWRCVWRPPKETNWNLVMIFTITSLNTADRR